MSAGSIQGFLSKLCAPRLAALFGAKPVVPPDERLLEAARTGNLDDAQEAIEDGADVKCIDCHGNLDLPIRIAAYHGHDQVIRLLLQHGADVNAPNYEGLSAPLRLAAKAPHRETIETLISFGAFVSPSVLGLMPDDRASLIRRRVAKLRPPAVVKAKAGPSDPGNPSVLPQNDAVPEPARELPPLQFEKASVAAPAPEPPPMEPAVPATVVHPAFPDAEVEHIEVEACYGLDSVALEEELIKAAANSADPEPAPAARPSRKFQRKGAR